MFENLGQKRTTLFDPPPYYGTPGINPDAPPIMPSGHVGLPFQSGISAPSIVGPRPGMMFRGFGNAPATGIPRAPVSLLPADTMPDQQSSLPAVTAMPALPPKKPAFFDKDGAWRDVLGALSDGMAGAAGMQPTYGPAKLRMRQQQAELQRRAQEDAARRAAERDEWLWREQWKQAHPDDQFTQFMIAGGIDPRSDQGRALYKQRAEGMAAPPLMAVDGFDAQGNPTKTFMPRPTFAPSVSPSNAGPAIGTMRNGYRFKGGNPNDRSSWEPVGGASPSGGATFR